VRLQVLQWLSADRAEVLRRTDDRDRARIEKAFEVGSHSGLEVKRATPNGRTRGKRQSYAEPALRLNCYHSAFAVIPLSIR
jgi:hypothetical protein